MQKETTVIIIKTIYMASLQDLDNGVKLLNTTINNDNNEEDKLVNENNNKRNNNFVPFTTLTCDITYETKNTNRTLKLKQKLPKNTPISPLFSDVWTGSCVWECSLLISRTIEMELINEFKNKNVLVLGSGCGLEALVCKTETECKLVVATDKGSIVALNQSNAELNLSTEEQKNYKVYELDWGSNFEEFNKEIKLKHFDIILACDCINPIYGKESWSNLAKTMAHFSAVKDTLILLGYEQREDEGPIENDELLNDFFKHCKMNSIEVEKLIKHGDDCRYIFSLRKTSS